MQSRAYLLLERYLSPSTGLSGPRHVPGACLRQVRPALLFAGYLCRGCQAPESLTPGLGADSTGCNRGGESLPADTALHLHSSDAAHASRPPGPSGPAASPHAERGSTGGLLPGDLVDITARLCITGTRMPPPVLHPLGSCQQRVLLGQDDSLLFPAPAFVPHFLQG